MLKRCCGCKNEMEPDAPPTRRYCLPCWRARAATYVAANAEKVKATQKAYRERVKAGVPSRPNSRGRSTLCYRCRVDMGPDKPKRGGYCKPCAAEMARERRARHPEGAKAANARWKTKYPGRVNELRKGKSKDAYTRQRDRILAYQRTQRAVDATGVKVRAYHNAWAAKNKTKVAEWTQQSRARRAGAPGSHTIAEWKSVLRHHKRLCVYCGGKLTRTNVTKDHVVPLSRGGSHDIRNIVPACRRCNSRKHTMTGAEFVAHIVNACP